MLISINPSDSDIANLGALLRRQGRVKEAMTIYLKWEALQERSDILNINAINCAIESRDFVNAEKWIKVGLKNGGNKEVEKSEVELLKCLKKNSEAEGKLLILLKKYPKDIGISLDAGKFYYAKDEKLKALNIFKNITKHDSHNKRAIANIITILQEVGEYKELDDVINNLSPEDVCDSMIKSSIAYTHMKRENPIEAERMFRELCDIEPQQPLHWLNRSACLKAVKHTNMAKRVAKVGYSIHPEFNELRQALGQFYAELGQHKQTIKLLEEDICRTNNYSDHHMYNMQFIGEGYEMIDSGELMRIARSWEQKKVKNTGIGNIAKDRIRERIDNRKIRVGYLSTDFCNHPVGRFILPILSRHSHTDFEVIALSCGNIEDDISKKINRVCNRWVDLSHTNDMQAARIISDLQLDILIELGGYTSGSRIGILVHKPVEVQLSYLGYYAPTYLKCIDGWLGDRTLFKNLNPIQRKAHKLLEVGGGYMTMQSGPIFEPKREAEDRVTFGSFNHSRKLSTKTVNLFCRIMKEAKEAILILKSISFIEEEEIERVKKMFLDKGLEQNRLMTIPWVEGRENHIKNYNKIDIALDPTPYGGATTTCEALLMGVPVISLHGEGMVGALSASILNSAGLEEFIATNEEEYVSKAINQYRKGINSSKNRIKFQKGILESNINNAKRVTEELERIYKELFI